MIAEYWPATVIRSGEDPGYSVCAKQSQYGNSLRSPVKLNDQAISLLLLLLQTLQENLVDFVLLSMNNLSTRRVGHGNRAKRIHIHPIGSSHLVEPRQEGEGPRSRPRRSAPKLLL